MATRNTITPSTELLRGVIQSYIEDGNLASSLRGEGCPSFPILRFVSYQDGVVRLLVGGDCPGCDSPWLRNICNRKFCKSATEVMQKAIPSVRDVVPVYTFDDDFITITHDFGYTIRFPVKPKYRMDFLSILKMMLDNHPMVGGFNKILSKRGNDVPDIARGSITTWDEMRTSYNGVWVVNSETSCLSMDGEIRQNDAILEDDFNLPPYLVDMSQPGVPMVMSYNPSFFEPIQYMYIDGTDDCDKMETENGTKLILGRRRDMS